MTQVDDIRRNKQLKKGQMEPFMRTEIWSANTTRMCWQHTKGHNSLPSMDRTLLHPNSFVFINAEANCERLGSIKEPSEPTMRPNLLQPIHLVEALFAIPVNQMLVFRGLSGETGSTRRRATQALLFKTFPSECLNFHNNSVTSWLVSCNQSVGWSRKLLVEPKHQHRGVTEG